MAIARTNDVWTESFVWHWFPAEDADQRAIAREAVAGLFSFMTSWIEPVALEARFGCYDPEIFGEALDAPPLAAPHHMLVRDPVDPAVEVKGAYLEPVVARAPRLDAFQVERWLAEGLEQPCGDPRYQTCLVELLVRSMAIALPAAWQGEAALRLDDPINRLTVAVERRGATAWVSGPPIGRNLYPPLNIALSNQDRELRLRVQVFWSPWEGEAARPDSDLARAAARLEARGWEPDPD